MSKKCDCQIGEINTKEPLTLELSNYVDRIISESKTTNQVREFFNENPKRTNKKNLTIPIDYLDRRKGYSTLFNYCPWCGSKINFKKLREAFK